MPRHVRKGDQVIVTSGDHKGQTGEILEILTKSDKVLVKGVNVKSRHVRPTQLNPKGGIVSKEMPMHISNVSPVVDGKPTRVRFETKKDGSKDRVAVRGGKSLGQVSGPKS
ncbi:MAG: 50S ribosomal protein L24 [Phycisphaerales bacterium]|nr:50S ribosomal protein L24 [Phycisphaerales bacterium]|tara:strand:+ start:11718 stop:12050 length:333 start_codon:yes stop_codon:yes gene_type:complete